ncbi:hypothetical protein A1359_10100 [Methylomonas lenta]|uniref:PEP-CTERM sorting domain-containing protein n=1 Tax=Methylomonas lenta TaxID=980561 RepID=A0A177NC82_9GAMM|nr:VPLPA-CTERM sorting domain-containing protein [Methylomonas lenta]OAI15053.1 hypothetical protein A1359_10100 [Methylomonas lenta]
MMKTKLARAIAMTLAGGALSLGAVSTASATSTTMYNMNLAANQTTGTDGWVWGGLSNPTYGTLTANFVGTASATSTPFGYSGTSHLNWALQLGAAGDTAVISKADSLQYNTASNWNGSGAEIDTGAGAWLDNTGTGWKHQTDIGLIKSDVNQMITINLTRLDALSSPLAPNDNFGVTIFSGMDTKTGSYSHHGGWNNPSKPSTTSNPFGTTGVNYVMRDGTVDAVNGITFEALAGQIYSIYLGGAGVGKWNANVSNYQLNVSSSPVPVPAAAWLFGGALISLVGANRRKKVLPA